MNDTDAFLQSLQNIDSSNNAGNIMMLNTNGNGNGSVKEMRYSDNGDVNMEYYTGGNGNKSSDPSPASNNGAGIPLEPMSITPESFHSYYGESSNNNVAQQPQNGNHGNGMGQNGRSGESPFDFSDYDEQVNFNNSSSGNIPQQQQQQQQQTGLPFLVSDVADDAFGASNDMVKSEFSPVIAPSSSSSGGSSMHNSNNNNIDINNNNFNNSDIMSGDDYGSYDADELVKDEFGMNLENVASGDEFTKITTKNGKVIKRRKEKTSHNIIEKKYRTNINDKIFQLREIVPALRVAYKRYAGIPVVSQDATDLDGLEPARKLNKASILMKTIEYIKHLELKCVAFRLENQQLKNNIPTPESLRPQSIPVRAPQQQSMSNANLNDNNNNNNNNIHGNVSTQFDQFYVSPSYSSVTSTGSSQTNNVANVSSSSNSTNNTYPGTENANENNGNDFASKFLMGGLAMTMGATCFGDNGDMGSARALFAMPVFHFSPKNGFALSNSNGVINLQASLFALLKLILVFATLLHLARWLVFASSKKTKKCDGTNDIISLIPLKDTVQFNTIDHLKETLKKTFVVNKLKYKYNSMERIESKMAKCFALKLYFENSNFSWKYLSKRYTDKKWSEIKTQVVAANLKSKGSLNLGLEWGMITNVVSVEQGLTLNDPELLVTLSKDSQELELKGFLSLLNAWILKNVKHKILNTLLEKTSTKNEVQLEQILETFHEDNVATNKVLRSMPEDYAVINCLITPNKENCDKVSKLIKINEEMHSENLLEEQLVLYGSVMRHLIKEEQFDQCNKWVKKMPVLNISGKDNKVTLVGFTAMYLMMCAVVDKMDKFRENVSVLETLLGQLRIWLGSNQGNVLEFNIRSKMIDYCIDNALTCGSIAGDVASSYFEVDDDETEFEDGNENVPHTVDVNTN